MHQKFIVVAEMSTDNPLELFYDAKLPGMHIALFEAAQQNWKKRGVNVSCFGGGLFAIIDNFVVFYGKSGQYGKYDDEVVLTLAAKHPLFAEMGYAFLSKVGENDPLAIVNSLRD
jgi:hypothetical protein